MNKIELPWFRVIFTDTTEAFVQASDHGGARMKAVEQRHGTGRTPRIEKIENFSKEFDQTQIANKSKEMIAKANGDFVEAIQACKDYAVIYATQQAFVCSGYWDAVARDLESRRDQMLSTWR